MMLFVSGQTEPLALAPPSQPWLKQSVCLSWIFMQSSTIHHDASMDHSSDNLVSHSQALSALTIDRLFS